MDDHHQSRILCSRNQLYGRKDTTDCHRIFEKSKYGVDYVDAITEPGPNRILADNRDQITIDSIRRGLEISVMKHGSKHVVIVGHHDCTINPTDKETQLGQIAAAFETVKSWGFPCEITGLWVDEQWKVHEV